MRSHTDILEERPYIFIIFDSHLVLFPPNTLYRHHAGALSTTFSPVPLPYKETHPESQRPPVLCITFLIFHPAIFIDVLTYHRPGFPNTLPHKGSWPKRALCHRAVRPGADCSHLEGTPATHSVQSDGRSLSKPAPSSTLGPLATYTSKQRLLDSPFL